MPHEPIDLQSRRDPSTAEQIQARLRAKRRDPRKRQSRDGPDDTSTPAAGVTATASAASAELIRNQIAVEANKRLPNADRIALAYNMNRIFSVLRGKRGALTDTLLNAGIAKSRAEHTKRAPNYSTADPGTANPKLLSSRINNYVRLAEEAARFLGDDPNDYIIKLFEGTRFDPMLATQGVSLDEFNRVQSLHDLLSQAGTTIASSQNLLDYFHNLTRWKWLDGADEHMWICDDLSESPNTPGDIQFLISRFALIPKVELGSCRIHCLRNDPTVFLMPKWKAQSLSMRDLDVVSTWSAPDTIHLSITTDADDSDHDVESDGINLEVRRTLWWGLIPSNDGERIEGAILTSLDVVTRGYISLDDGRTLNLEERAIPGAVFFQGPEEGFPAYLQAIFELAPSELSAKLYIDVEWALDEPDTVRLEADFPKEAFRNARIRPFSMGTLFSELVEQGRLERFDTVAGMPSPDANGSAAMGHSFRLGTGPSRAPKGTLAGEIEGILRYSPWDSPERIDMKMVETCEHLQRIMKESIERIEKKMEKMDSNYADQLKDQLDRRR